MILTPPTFLMPKAAPTLIPPVTAPSQPLADDDSEEDDDEIDDLGV